MSRHLGDFDASTVIYGKFTTYRPSTGAPFTLAGSPVLSVYKDNSTTESTTGVTLTVDFDSRTGMHHYAIDTSADGTFYAAGSFFDVVVTTGTVDSVSAVGTIVGSFTIRKTSVLKPTVAGRTLDVSSGGEAGLDWANVGSPTTSLALTGTTIATTQKVDVETIKTQAVTAAAGVTFPSSIASPTNITAATGIVLSGVTHTGAVIPTVTNLTNAPTAGDFTTTMKTSIGTAVAASAVASVTGNVGGNVTGSVGSIATGGITAASFAAGAIDAAAIATDAIDADAIKADAVTEIQTGLATPTNITAATGIVLSGVTHTGAVIPTVTNLTNAATAGDFTATMKTSIGTAVAASAVASVTGNVGGNVVGSVGSISGVTFPANFSVLAIAATTGQVGLNFDNVKQATAGTTLNNITVPTVTTLTNLPAITTDWLTGTGVAASAVTKIQSGLATPTNITAATGIVLSGVTHTGAVIPLVTTTTTATNLTNAPTAGDFTATMKTSIGTAVAASAVASVTGNVGGNVTGSVGSVVAAVIKKNTALAAFEFMMTDSTNHLPATGKTVTCTRSIDGGSFAAGTLASIAEVAFGIYRVSFAAADLNGNVVTLRATATGCDDTFITFNTNP